MTTIFRKAEFEKDGKLIDDIVRVVNAAYVETEGDLWAGECERTTRQEVEKLMKANQLTICLCQKTEENGDSEELIGSIHVEPEYVALEEEVENKDERNFGQWGMLAVKPEWRGKKLGKKLVEIAEEMIFLNRDVSRIGLMVPADDGNEFKRRLRTWYRDSLGYKFLRKTELAELHPHLDGRVKPGVMLEIYIKKKQQ